MPLVLYELSDHIATITLNRPEAHNALSRDLIRELRDAFKRFRTEEEARVAILTGAGGKAFSAGADLKEMAQRSAPRETTDGAQSNRPSSISRFLGRTSDELFTGTEPWKPLIAAIDGYCLAGGLELALTTDIRIASDKSKFGLTEVTRGIIAGGGGTQRLPRAIPLALAMEILLTGRHMDAEEALRAGLINRVVPSDQVMPTALEIAQMIARNAPLSVRATKEAVMRGMEVGLNEGIRIEAFLSQMIGRTEDAREGPKAFAEKRQANYVGR